MEGMESKSGNKLEVSFNHQRQGELVIKIIFMARSVSR